MCMISVLPYPTISIQNYKHGRMLWWINCKTLLLFATDVSTYQWYKSTEVLLLNPLAWGKEFGAI